MAYVTIPKDLSRIQSKVLFGLTKRQVICFGAAALVGVPLFFLAKASLGTTTAALCMILVKLFQPEKETVGLCPRCGKPVYEGKKNFACSDRACQFVMWKNDRFWTSRCKEMTRKMAADLLKKGRTSVKGMWSEKKGSTYDAVVILDDTGGKYVNFKLEFPKRKDGVHGKK